MVENPYLPNPLFVPYVSSVQELGAPHPPPSLHAYRSSVPSTLGAESVLLTRTRQA